LSIPATDLPAHETDTIIELPGQAALSAFRLRKLVADLRQLDPRIGDLQARFSYFICSTSVLSRNDTERLDSLLLSGEPVEDFAPGGQLIYTAPRPGTISPWSNRYRQSMQAR